MTAHLSNSGNHWGNSGGYEPRPVTELFTRADCLEEIFFEVLHTMTMVPLIEDISHIRSQRGALYDRVEAIVIRAEDLRLLAASGNQSPSE